MKKHRKMREREEKKTIHESDTRSLFIFLIGQTENSALNQKRVRVNENKEIKT